MCNQSGIDFAASLVAQDWITNKRVLEVGARDVNGSVRPLIEAHHPALYIGVDIEAGPRVDEVLDGRHLIARFGRESFDAVISTEMLEHVRDWRATVTNMKAVLKPGGVLLITTRSRGFPLHGWPGDYWRYEVADLRRIFADMEILALEQDELQPGVFLFARSRNVPEQDLESIALYSMIAGRRVTAAQERGVLLRLIYPVRRLWGRVPEPVRAPIRPLAKRGASRMAAAAFRKS